MNQHTPFIDAILLDPEADLPRLIYADWLDESDDAARAELIRVQCELARPCPGDHLRDVIAVAGVGANWTKDTCPCKKCEKLRARERELLKAIKAPARTNWFEWKPRAGGLHCYNLLSNDNDPSFPAHSVEFRRGFVAVVRCTAADWLTHGQAILREQPVERVELTDIRRALEIQPPSKYIQRWSLWIRDYPPHEPGRDYPQDKLFPTRAALIDAMPQQLREWGVGGIPEVRRLFQSIPMTQEWMDDAVIDVERILYGDPAAAVPRGIINAR